MKLRSVGIGVALIVPAIVGTVLLIRSGLGGDDFQPERWLATGSGPRYGASYLYAYPLPAYVPALPIAALPAGLSHAIVLIVCVALLGLALWLWHAVWRSWFFLMTSTPVVYALITTHLFSCAALLGCTLVFWAVERRRMPVLLGLGLALAAIRPVNALPLVAVIAWTHRAEWRRLAAAAGIAVLMWIPFALLAFAIDPQWPADYVIGLRVYPVAGVIQLVYALGPIAYAIALITPVAASLAVAAYRGPQAGVVVGIALSVVVAPLPGPYSVVFALPALIVAARQAGYEWFPGIVSAIGWLATIALLISGLPPAIAAYWYVINCYPLVRAAGRARATRGIVGVNRGLLG